MGSITEATVLHHVCIVLLLLWVLNYFNCCNPLAYFMSFTYLFLVHERYEVRLRKKLQFEEKRESNQRRVLSDTESVRWLNHAIGKIWPICMEDIVSQKILLPLVPWFLEKYKPWTVKDAAIQSLYLGRSPPVFSDMRIRQNANGDDHLVLELGINFRTADDMSAILGVKLRKRLGFGMLAKMHLLGMHVEGKVVVGVKFIQKWPFIGRLRVCFAAPPYFQMIVKPIFTHGLDVTEVPGVAGWIENLLALVFEQTLVEPNMLVVDVEKFASPEPDKSENWFSVDAKEPIAHIIVEILEATEMKPSDLNGLADPYVKGKLGHYRFRTKTQKKTLTPKWNEEFKIPICTWESENMLEIEVFDKDRMFDDSMGDCCVDINELRDGQRHDMWLPLQNIKMGRLHLAVTVSEGSGKGAEPLDAEGGAEPLLDAEGGAEPLLDAEGGAEPLRDAEGPQGEDKRTSFTADDSPKKSSFSSRSSERSPKVADKFESIDIEGQSETGIWIHHPGSEVAQMWEPRKGKGGLQLETVGSFKSSQNDSSSTDESNDADTRQKRNSFRKGLDKIGSIFRHRSPKPKDKTDCLVESPEPSPQETTVPPSLRSPNDEEKEAREENLVESPRVKDMAKGILKHAGKGLKLALSGKSSRKPKSGSGPGLLAADKDAILAQDSSSDESRSPTTGTPLAESGQVIPGSAASSPALVSGNNSFKSKDRVTQAVPPSADNSIQTGAG